MRDGMASTRAIFHCKGAGVVFSRHSGSCGLLLPLHAGTPLRRIGRHLYRSDYIEHAISEYQQAIADDPDSLFLRVQLGQLYWRVDRIGDALSEAQYVLKANPNDLDAHRLLGDIYLHSLRENQTQAKQRQSLEKAIHEYEAIIRLAPNDIRSAVLLGRLYGLDNHPEKAEAIFKKILNDHPDSTSALSYLGKLYIDQEQYQQAIQL